MITDLWDVPATIWPGWDSRRARLGLEQPGEAQPPHRQPAELEELPPRPAVADTDCPRPVPTRSA